MNSCINICLVLLLSINLAYGAAEQCSQEKAGKA